MREGNEDSAVPPRLREIARKLEPGMRWERRRLSEPYEGGKRVGDGSRGLLPANDGSKST